MICRNLNCLCIIIIFVYVNLIAFRCSKAPWSIQYPTCTCTLNGHIKSKTENINLKDNTIMVVVVDTVLYPPYFNDDSPMTVLAESPWFVYDSKEQTFLSDRRQHSTSRMY